MDQNSYIEKESLKSERRKEFSVGQDTLNKFTESDDSRRCIKDCVFHKYNVVVVTQPLLKDGEMAREHGAPEAGLLSMACTKGCKVKMSRQKMSGAESHSRTAQNEVKDDLSRMITGAAQRISILRILDR